MSLDLTNAGLTKISFKCPQCRESLFRITRPADYDKVYCLTDRIGGDYKEIVEQGGQLKPYALSTKDVGNITAQFGLFRRDDL